MKKIFIFSLFFVSFLSQNLFAIVLEDLSKHELCTLISHKKIGFYVGSFDPIHKGHESVVSNILAQGLVDYCLIYPAWGGDHYKNRTDVQLRLEMLFALYKDSPKVIVTKLDPGQLQDLLTKDSDLKIVGKPTVKSAFEGTQYIGVIGSDTALETVKDEKKLSVFLKGIKLPDQYKQHTIGAIIALPAHTFIVNVRQGDDVSSLKGQLEDRPITDVLHLGYSDASSTKVRQKIQNNEDISDMVSPSTIEIIQKNGLYK